MSTDRWERLAPLTGVLAVVLWVAAILTIVAVGDVPGDKDPSSDFVTFFEKETGAIFVGSALFGLGLGAFLWFLGSLRATLRQAEAGSGRLSAVVFGAGVVLVGLGMLAMAPFAAGAAAFDWLGRDSLSPEAAEALWVLQSGIFFFVVIATIPLFLAAGLVSLRTRALPLWYGWITVLLAVAAIVPWIGWLVGVIGLPLWVLVTSLLLFWKGRAPASL